MLKFAPALLFLFLPVAQAGAATALPEPDINQCSTAEGITKCEVVCVRNLGEQCLVSHVNFEGQNLKPGSELLRARFLTCIKADVDFQLKSLVLALTDPEGTNGKGIVSANAKSSTGSAQTIADRAVVFDSGKAEGRLSRIPFNAFLNSGESHMETTLQIEQCGGDGNDGRCDISGKLVAVTNPNIRCDFHDTSQSGAFRKPKLQISPSLQNSQLPVGRIGQQ